VKQIVVLSGKGGTGKTFVSASLSALAAPVVSVDCDVDAANLALVLEGKDVHTEDFFAGQTAVIDADACTGCSDCIDECVFDALSLDESGTAVVDEHKCDGCGVCSLVCGEDAVSMKDNLAGRWFVRRTKSGYLVHAALGIAQDNSGKLVARIRQEAVNTAENESVNAIIIDGPPGIGCPVHASVTGADLVLAVSEPTVSGIHDLKRLIDLCSHFEIKCAVVINKFDLDVSRSRQIEEMIESSDLLSFLGKLPFDRQVPLNMALGIDPLEISSFGPLMKNIWKKTLEMLK